MCIFTAKYVYMNPADIEIINLIPQRPPMVMIDRLIYFDEKTGRATLQVNDSNILCKNGFLQEAGLIECIAQTAAAYKGFAHFSAGKKIPDGFIGSVKSLVIYFLPEVESEIQSEIITDSEIMGYTIILGKILQEGKILAECEMRILSGAD
jgi:predicted hotdog family 3-hydroxylacyl-ACP dehydratase